MKKILTILLCTIMFFSVGVLADSQLSVSAVFDAKTEYVQIFGSAPSGDVIIVVTDYMNQAENSDENYPYDIISAVSKGSYSVTLKLPDKASGKKLLVTATDVYGNSETDFFSNPNFSEANTIIDNVNSASDISEFMSIVRPNAYIFGFDTDSDIYTESQDYIYAILYAVKPDNATPADLYNLFYSACALAGLEDTSRSETEQLLNTDAFYLGIDYVDDYANDDRLDDDAKSVLCDELAKSDYSKILSQTEDFSDYLEKLKALANIRTAQRWQDIRDVMENDFSELFNLASLSNTKAQTVYSKMMNYQYMNFADIASNYEKAISDLDTDSNKNSSGSGGGGGGKGSGSVVSIPPAVEIQLPADSSQLSTAVKSPMVTLPENATSNFVDVPNTHWSYAAVSALSEAGIINGYDAWDFRPANSITRAEFTKLVCSAFGIPQSDAEFYDVADDAWYNGYVGGACSYGIVSGYNDMFSPDSSITRQDAAVIVYRALKNEGIILNGSASFDDSNEIALYALTAVGAFKQYGILNGDGTYFYPLSNITRAEAAQLLYKALTAVK